jgi:two-component system chemotaxis response regulator CheY
VGKNVLLADDDETVRTLLRIVLERNGLTVTTAEDGREALDLIRRQRPDLILLDLRMPRLNGYQLFAELKADDALKSIPIIVITALTRESDREDEEWARRMGAEGFLTKPFTPDELGRRVQEIIGRLT